MCRKIFRAAGLGKITEGEKRQKGSAEDTRILGKASKRNGKECQGRVRKPEVRGHRTWITKCFEKEQLANCAKCCWESKMRIEN